MGELSNFSQRNAQKIMSRNLPAAIVRFDAKILGCTEAAGMKYADASLRIYRSLAANVVIPKTISLIETVFALGAINQIVCSAISCDL